MIEQAMRRRDAAGRAVRMIAAHEEQVCCRQDRHGDAGIGQTPCNFGETLRRQRGKLGDMADRDAAAVAMGRGLAANLIKSHPGWVEIEVEMKVDVETEPGSEREDARDVPMRIVV